MDGILTAGLIGLIIILASAIFLLYKQIQHMGLTLARLSGIVETSSSTSLSKSIEEIRLKQGEISERINNLKEKSGSVETKVDATKDSLKTDMNNIKNFMAPLSAKVESVISNVSELKGKSDEVKGKVDTTKDGLKTEIDNLKSLINQIQVKVERGLEKDNEAIEVLEKLESVITGTKSRGVAGENILEDVLRQLPPELWEAGFSIGGKQVEFVLKLPMGKVLPIDSKWTSSELLEVLNSIEDPDESRRIINKIESEVSKRSEEIAKYLNPDITIGMGLLAVPDAVYHLCSRVHAKAHSSGVLIVSYSLALPYLLALLQLVYRFASQVDVARMSAALKTINAEVDKISDKIENSISRSNTMINNASSSIRSSLSIIRTVIEGIQGVQGISPALNLSEIESSNGSEMLDGTQTNGRQ